MLFDLTGKVALVTGANTGIGQGIALALAEAGADIAAAGRSPADETVGKIRGLGRKGENFAADLSSIGAVQPLVDAVLAEFRSEEHTSELQSLMRISYAVFCLKN